MWHSSYHKETELKYCIIFYSIHRLYAIIWQVKIFFTVAIFTPELNLTTENVGHLFRRFSVIHEGEAAFAAVVWEELANKDEIT